MFWIFCLLTAAVVSELCVGYRPLWFARRLIAMFGIVAGLLSASAILILHPGFPSAALAVTTAYSCFNLARVLTGRNDVRYLMPAINRAAIWLSSAKVVTAYWVVVANYSYLAPVVPLIVLVSAQLVVAITILFSVWRQLRTTAPIHKAPALTEKQWPSVTVAVPARNEGGQLEDCLTAILASDYRKLEVLALDDDSHDRTADIIRSFAHAGVRFINGPKSSEGWLPKNQACAALADASSGEYLMFCGSDIRLSPHAIRELVANMVEKRKTMLAIVPQNTAVRVLPAVQAMRYFWEMAPPRRLFRRPPVLSSCWIITRQSFDKAGGFAAVQRSVTPEAHFAHHAMVNGDGYSFVRSDDALGVVSEKPLANQRETAIFSRYPQLHRRPEMVMLLTVAELLLLLGPVLCILAALVVDVPIALLIASLISLIMNVYSFGRIQQPIFSSVSLLRIHAGYFGAILADIYYVNRSMYRYEFGTVVYSGREISAQVRDKYRKG
jgi:glycosyltransferase involved in cell wall biosynthesis